MEDRKWAIKALRNGNDEKYEEGWKRVWGRKCPKGYKKCINCNELCYFKGE